MGLILKSFYSKYVLSIQIIDGDVIYFEKQIVNERFCTKF